MAPLQIISPVQLLSVILEKPNSRVWSATCAPRQHLQVGPRDHFGRSQRSRIGRVSLRGPFAGTGCSSHLMQQRWLHLEDLALATRRKSASRHTIPTMPACFHSETQRQPAIKGPLCLLWVNAYGRLAHGCGMRWSASEQARCPSAKRRPTGRRRGQITGACASAPRRRAPAPASRLPSESRRRRSGYGRAALPTQDRTDWRRARRFRAHPRYRRARRS